MSFSTDFALQQLFGAKDAQEIEKRSTVYDFLTQGHLPLIERQQGWIVEIKTRKNGNVDDKLYTHEKSNLTFRSLKQVKAFICNHTLPKKQAISIRRRRPVVPIP